MTSFAKGKGDRARPNKAQKAGKSISSDRENDGPGVDCFRGSGFREAQVAGITLRHRVMG